MEYYKKNSELISVIVPIYNVEKYISKCVTSILQQTYKNLEVILVDDGSKDESGQICDEFSKDDSRVVVIHKENGGLSSARNAGLDIARGKYISLIDGDDYIHPQMYERLLQILQKEKADIVSCNFKMLDENEKVPIKKYDTSIDKNEYTTIIGRKIYWQLWLRDNETIVQCTKLFRKEIFEHCRYPIGKLHEDVYMIHQQLEKCHKIIYVNEELYYYVQRSNSIMHRESYVGIRDAVEGYEQRALFFKTKNYNYEYQQTLRMLFNYLMWKYEINKKNATKKETDRLICLYQGTYKKYRKDIKFSEEEKVLYRMPKHYDAFIRYKQRKNGICCRIKKLIGLVKDN